LSDLAFQRHILVQGLILLDFLLSFTEKAKKKLAAKKGAVKAQFTLSEADVSST
jgi:THO complex subunit 1